MRKAIILGIMAIFIISCATQIPVVQQTTAPPKVEATPPQTEPEAPTAQPEECMSDLQPQQITDIKVNFENGLQKTADGFIIRALPVDSTGTQVIPAEGNINIAVYASKPDFPKQKDYKLFSRGYYVKKEAVMSDCGPKPITILWKDIKASQNWHWVKTPNYGVIEIEFIRTGSEQLFEKSYYGAQRNEYILN